MNIFRTIVFVVAFATVLMVADPMIVLICYSALLTYCGLGGCPEDVK